MSTDAIRDTFRFGGAYPFIGFLLSLDSATEERINKNKISDSDLSSIARNVECAIIGAYDEESYLVLELSRE